MNHSLGRYWSWLLLVLLSVAANGQTVSMEPGTDRMGSDYKAIALASAEPALCQKACAADAACKAFTYVRPGLKGPSAMCFLKSSVPASTPDPCCTSGVRAAGGRPASTIQTHPLGVPSTIQTPVAPVDTTVVQIPTNAVRPAPPKPPDPEVDPIIPAPSSAKAIDDAGQYEVTWTWSAIGCFPGGPGTTPKPCRFVQDIEGFKVYAFAGGLRTTVRIADARYASLAGKETNKCYVVTAFKGEIESAPSPVACVDQPKTLYKISSAIATPSNLRATKDPAVCAAAAGGFFTGLFCDAAIKSNAQILLWDYSSSAIDGFRLYDAVKGEPYTVDTKANKDARMFAVQPAPIVLSDWCFTVRAYKGDTESPSSNPICLTPKGPAPKPVKPLVIIAPVSGIAAGGFQSLKDQNSGCPFAEQHRELRWRTPLGDVMTVYWIHKDLNILCGDRRIYWVEGSILFPLDEIPSGFKSVELRFTSNDSVAKEGTEGGLLGAVGNKPTFNVNCIKSIHAYDIIVANNSALDSDQLGEPDAYFSWMKEDLIATQTQAHTTHRFDVTALVKKSLIAGKKKLGFVWEVDKNLAGDNDMCITSFHDFALEVKPKG